MDPGPLLTDGSAGVVSDHVLVDVPPGRYVLGWRHDAEETAQVWNNCADVIVE